MKEISANQNSGRYVGGKCNGKMMYMPDEGWIHQNVVTQ